VISPPHVPISSLTADSNQVAGPLKPWESRACGRLSEAALSFKPANSNIRWVRTHRRCGRKENTGLTDQWMDHTLAKSWTLIILF
ncbi:hypothetical protein ABVT39_015380, partial [Epinephelus coioides]